MSMVNVQDELLCAIELGDLSCVKRVVNGCGFDMKTVLHSPFRHENATVLGTAALEGQVIYNGLLVVCNNAILILISHIFLFNCQLFSH